MRVAVACAILLLLGGVAAQVCDKPPTSPGDRRPDKTRLKVATFNLAWLFDGVNDPSGSQWVNDPAGAQMHIDTVAQEIIRANADVFAVHEVESCTVLDSLIAKLPGYKGYLVQGTDTGTGQNSALITRVDPSSPLVRFETRADLPVSGSTCGVTAAGSTGVSKHFRTTIKTSTMNLTIIAAHLKSGGLATDCQQREGQAQVMRGLYTPNTDTIILGDFNDWNTQFVDGKGKTGTSRTLPILQGADMVDAGGLLAVTDRISTSIGLIDHILMSPSINSKRFVSALTDRAGYPTTSASLLAGFYSDHYAFVVTLRDDINMGAHVTASVVLLVTVLLASVL